MTHLLHNRSFFFHVTLAPCINACGAMRPTRAVSDAVRILLTRVTKEGGLPAGLTVDPEAYDTWFRANVQEALEDTRPAVPRRQVMDEAQALIDRKCRVGS